MLIDLYFSLIKGDVIKEPWNPSMQGFTWDLCSSSSNPTQRPCSPNPPKFLPGHPGLQPGGKDVPVTCWPCWGACGGTGHILSQVLTTIIRFYSTQVLLHGHQSNRNAFLWKSGKLPEGCLGFHISKHNPEPSDSEPGTQQIHHGLMGTEECSVNSPVSRPPCNFTAIWGPRAPQKVLK